MCCNALHSSAGTAAESPLWVPAGCPPGMPQCQCIHEEQLSGTQLPSLGCHGASEAHGCEHLQAEEGWAKGEEPSVVELHVAHPCFLLPAITGRGDALLCGTVRARTRVGESWVLINALLFMLRKKRGGGRGGCVHQASAEATVQSWYWLAEGP